MPYVHTLDTLTARLAELDAQHLRRRRRVVESADGPHMVVDGQPVLAFCSNDYLGLAQHPALIEAAQQAAAQFGVGTGASPLVCGHTAAHEALERELAAFVGRPRALFFYAGFAANVGAIPALVGAGDAIFSDKLNHACLLDGALLSGARARRYPHNDVAALARLMEASDAPRKLVVTDAVFSMDGDLAPLRDLLALCDRHDAWLLIDDAHGFGVLGPNGEGTAAHLGLRSPRLLYMATLGKAAGGAGAFYAGEEAVIETLISRCRSYVFATSAPAMQAQALRASLQVIQAEGWRRTHLNALIARLRAGLQGLPWSQPDSSTAIQPLIVGDNAAALALSDALRAQGLWVPAIRPPTVPAGTARLRIALSAAHSEAEVDRLVGALQRLAREPSLHPTPG